MNSDRLDALRERMTGYVRAHRSMLSPGGSVARLGSQGSRWTFMVYLLVARWQPGPLRGCLVWDDGSPIGQEYRAELAGCSIRSLRRHEAEMVAGGLIVIGGCAGYPAGIVRVRNYDRYQSGSDRGGGEQLHTPVIPNVENSGSTETTTEGPQESSPQEGVSNCTPICPETADSGLGGEQYGRSGCAIWPVGVSNMAGGGEQYGRSGGEQLHTPTSNVENSGSTETTTEGQQESSPQARGVQLLTPKIGLEEVRTRRTARRGKNGPPTDSSVKGNGNGDGDDLTASIETACIVWTDNDRARLHDLLVRCIADPNSPVSLADVRRWLEHDPPQVADSQFPIDWVRIRQRADVTSAAKRAVGEDLESATKATALSLARSLIQQYGPDTDMLLPVVREAGFGAKTAGWAVATAIAEVAAGEGERA
jgi:hypothetical protein